MKRVSFRGTSLSDLKAFPDPAKRRAGYQIDNVQNGLDPDDWKPMEDIGAGVKEIRLKDTSGIYRVLYVAKVAETVYVLHCFKKTTQQTSKADKTLATKRTKDLVQELRTGVADMTTFTSVWDAIEDTPEQAENMKLRSALMQCIEARIRAEGWSQHEAAKRFRVTQPRVSDLMRGKIEKFTIDTLVNMVFASGLQVQLHVGTPEMEPEVETA
jgi:phage-related protein/predicted XRE-type DNA-binding protein